jgi:AcrR family transcriptional regulator
MDYKITFKVNDKIYLRDPEGTELGRNIVKNAIDLISCLGFEAFTFKKLAAEIGTTEATIYRYFENKHRLLLFILNWYWSYLEFLLEFKLQGINDNKKKLKIIIQLLTHELPESSGHLDYNKKYLHQIVITESSKVYLVKDVNEINREQVFKPYKDLCAKIADVISLYNSNYKYPRTLSSTLVETAHFQQYFGSHLPNLNDKNKSADEEFVAHFLDNLLFKVLD